MNKKEIKKICDLKDFPEIEKEYEELQTYTENISSQVKFLLKQVENLKKSHKEKSDQFWKNLQISIIKADLVNDPRVDMSINDEKEVWETEFSHNPLFDFLNSIR